MAKMYGKAAREFHARPFLLVLAQMPDPLRGLMLL